MPISQELQQVYASAPQDVREVQTLQLTHSQFPQDYFITNDAREWIFALETGALATFLPIPFAVVLPQQDGRGQQDLQITIDNVGREIMQPIEWASWVPTEPIRVVWRAYLDRPYSLPQNDPVLDLRLSNVVIGLQAVTGTATRADTLNRNFPSVVYRAELYPGLDR